MASAEPCTSALTTSGNSLRPAPSFRSRIMSASERPADAAARGLSVSRFWRVRYSVISRARASELDDRDAVAGLRRAVEAQNLDRNRGSGLLDVRAAVADQGAHAAPLGAGDDDVAGAQGAALDEHGRHRAAAAIELRLDDRAFRRAIGIGLEIEDFGLELQAFEQRIETRRRSWPRPRTRGCRRPSNSTTISCCSSSVRTRCGLASGLSILLMATISGTPAALAWLIASTVCGMTPSSAATTSTTMSVTLAPRARMAVKAAWPGVSMKVILPPSGDVTW